MYIIPMSRFLQKLTRPHIITLDLYTFLPRATGALFQHISETLGAVPRRWEITAYSKVYNYIPSAQTTSIFDCDSSKTRKALFKQNKGPQFGF